MESFRLVLVSSSGLRDGMALELQTADGEQVADVFEDDANGKRSVRFYTEDDVPLEQVEWLLRSARERL